MRLPKKLDHLPNELLTKILANIDIPELILLRAVSSRWLAAIEAICLTKRSILVHDCIANRLIGWKDIIEFNLENSFDDVIVRRYAAHPPADVQITLSAEF